MTDKEAKKKKKGKYPKSEMTPYNPFAVCNESVGTEDTEKRERCIQHVKEKNRDSHKKSAEERLMEKVASKIASKTAAKTAAKEALKK